MGSKLTKNKHLMGLAVQHSRMLEVAIIRGNREMAHAIVDRAFEERKFTRLVSEQSSVREVTSHRVACVLESNHFELVGDLIQVSRTTLAEITGLRYRTIDLIESRLEKNGFAFAKP